jgi:hypothetical protein
VILCILSNFRILSQENDADNGERRTPAAAAAAPSSFSRIKTSTRGTRYPSSSQSLRSNSKYDEILEELSVLSVRFYMYSDKAIVQREVREDLKHKRGDTLNHPKMPFIREAYAEVQILDALEKHSLRTLNPDAADLFVIPTSTSAILMKRTPAEATKIYAEAFGTLLSTPTFQATGGNRHVLVSTALWGFSRRSVQEKNVAGFGLRTYYDALRNVTIANDMDYAGCRELSKNEMRVDFIEHFRGSKGGIGKVTNSDFSLGLMASEDIPFFAASYDKFLNSKNFVFYHVRDREFIRNSTPFRRAPLRDEVIKGLPPSSIGPDLPYDDWLREFPSSRFCLAIRGDTPHSHALLRAVKVGCIPVVICDSYPLYAPTLKSSVDMRDYAIFIPEKQFLEDPLQELLKLNDLSEAVIRDKLEALAFAQRVIQPDHPESLFVPAFLREALQAQRAALDP